MPFLPQYSNPNTIVILITDKKHKKFGKLGRINREIAPNRGVEYYVIYADGTKETLPLNDGLFEDYYRRKNTLGKDRDKFGQGPESFKLRWLRLRKPEKLERLADEYHELFKPEVLE